MLRHRFILLLGLLLFLAASLTPVAWGVSQIKTVSYVEKITFTCISGDCYKVYGLRINHSLTVYVEYWVNLTIPSPTGNVLARLVVNNTWVHETVYLNLLGRNKIGTSSWGPGYYVDITPEDFGSRRSPYLAVDPPIAITFDPRPEEVVKGFFIARAGEPYPYANPNIRDFTLHYFELYYDPETKLFVGGRMHFIYIEYEKIEGSPIIYGIYDVYAEVLPASGQPPWKITGGGQATASSSGITTPQSTSRCQANWTPFIVTLAVVTVFFMATLSLCYKRWKHK
ncbi:MAG: hypothetical protein GSR76_05060 [Desulfurococcales archaeon]|nr:hypothetical protein [Desulfurococcales archaeon]